MASLARITVYPIKSLDGISTPSVEITQGGSLQYDREFAFVNDEGKFINGKKYNRIHLIRTIFHLREKTVEFSFPQNEVSKIFHLEKQTDEISSLISDFLGSRVSLRQNTENGFPDDLSASGPTIAGSQSLSEVTTWFPQLSFEEVHRRFRPNLLLNTDAPFWEDQLFGEKGDKRKFLINDVEFWGTNPCARCAVPTKNPETAEPITGFQKHFSEMRKQTLPPWSSISQFDHYYRFCVNTFIPSAKKGKLLSVGDVVTVDSTY